jgi:hypothetical protein
MSPRLTGFALTSLLLASVALRGCASQPRSPHPQWTGIWETEQAARLLETGEFTPPQLWRRPPGKALLDDVLPPTFKACEPGGMPEVMEYPVPDALFETLVTPDQTVLLWNTGTVRHIYTDGRGHPPAEDLWPTPEGHSIGHWEDGTLIVHTIARRAGPVASAPDAAVLSENARFTERLQRRDADTLVNEMTIEDPERLDHPWKLSITYRRVKDMDRLMATNCLENDRNPLVEGQFTIAAP